MSDLPASTAQVPTRSRPSVSAIEPTASQCSRNSGLRLKRKRSELVDKVDREFSGPPSMLYKDDSSASQDSPRSLKSDVNSKNAPSTPIQRDSAKDHSRSSTLQTPVVASEASPKPQSGGETSVSLQPVTIRSADAPHIFIPSIDVPVSHSTARLLQKKFKTFGNPGVRVVQAGYFVEFQDDKDGLRDLELCYNRYKSDLALEKYAGKITSQGIRSAKSPVPATFSSGPGLELLRNDYSTKATKEQHDSRSSTLDMFRIEELIVL